MKKLSLKAKLTLLYTALMTAMVCGVLLLLFSLSSWQILESVQSRLRECVIKAQDDVEFDDGELEFDSDFNDLEKGVYLSVYGSDGTFFYGRIPYGFENVMAFEEGAVRSFVQSGKNFYVMDISADIEGFGSVFIRGVASATDAEENILVFRRLSLILLPLLVILTGVLVYSMTRRALRPVGRMTDTVNKIRRDKDLSRRIGLSGGSDEIYRLAQTFDGLLEQVEESLNREKQFTSDVSHELRTPIAAMMLQCEELQSREDLAPEVREGVAFLSQKVRYLSQMISQLLLLSRADQGREQVSMERLDFSELTEMAVLEGHEMAASKDIHVEHEIEQGLYMMGDETLLIRLWMNLLENAVRYGKEKGHIRIRLWSQEEKIWGSIEDDGIGISQEDLPHIWERFYQADIARTDNDSSGLGLSMVKWIVKVHKGEIQAESRLGQGSRFKFCFPRQTKNVTIIHK